MYLDCHSAKYLGFRKDRRTQRTVHSPQMGELAGIRPKFPLDLEGGDRSPAQG
jgi:hypothetical protein